MTPMFEEVSPELSAGIVTVKSTAQWYSVQPLDTEDTRATFARFAVVAICAEPQC